MGTVPQWSAAPVTDRRELLFTRPAHRGTRGKPMTRIILLIALALTTAGCQSEAEREKAWVNQCVENEMTPKQCAFLYGQIIHARAAVSYTHLRAHETGRK